MYEPEVTVITPTSNIVDAGKIDDFTLLVNLLEKQTYPFIEHIIVDNASSDGTIDVLKEYKNSGYLNFYSEKDNGKYDAINKGLMRAKGKYVLILSCDDFIHDITGVAEVVLGMEEDEADYCCCQALCRQPDGLAFLYEPSILNVFQVMPCSHQATFFKKEALEKLGYFDSKFQLFADYDMILRLVLNHFNGILFDKSFVTYNMSEQVLKYQVQVAAECKHIYHKNYRNLYPMTDEIADRIYNLSEIPEPLLRKLAEYFPESQDEFYEKYEIMYNMRMNAMMEQRRPQGNMMTAVEEEQSQEG